MHQPYTGDRYAPSWAGFVRCASIREHPVGDCRHVPRLILPKLRTLRLYFELGGTIRFGIDNKSTTTICGTGGGSSRWGHCSLVKSLRPITVVLKIPEIYVRENVGMLSWHLNRWRPHLLPTSVKKLVLIDHSINTPFGECFSYQDLFSHCPVTLEEIVNVYHLRDDPDAKQSGFLSVNRWWSKMNLTAQGNSVPYPTSRQYSSSLEEISVICARMPCKVTVAIEYKEYYLRDYYQGDRLTTVTAEWQVSAKKEAEAIEELQEMVEKEKAIMETLRGTRGTLSKAAWRRLDQEERIKIMNLSEYRKLPYAEEELGG